MIYFKKNCCLNHFSEIYQKNMTLFPLSIRLTTCTSRALASQTTPYKYYIIFLTSLKIDNLFIFIIIKFFSKANADDFNCRRLVSGCDPDSPHSVASILNDLRIIRRFLRVLLVIRVLS